MKRCPECGEDRPLDCFFRDKTKASGRATYCKPCQTQRWLEWSRGPGHDRVLARTQRDYRRRGGWAAIADKRNESRRRRYREDPEYRRRVLDRAAERYAADPGLRERLTAKATARNRERPDRIIEATQLRRARIAEVRVGPVSRQRVMERDDWTCWICETPVDRSKDAPRSNRPSLDHVVALSDGGEHSEDNLRCAHLGCNIRRYHRERRSRRDRLAA